jgi:hypothetical protein
VSEEEIKDIFNLICKYNALNYFGYNSSEIGYTALNEALSLIDKLQKENRQLKAFYENDYIRKDKIKNKIKETEFYINNVDNAEGQAIYKVLKELLGEQK